MNKSELIDVIAKRANLTKAHSKKVVEILLETTSGALAKKETVRLVGFGTFSVVERPPRMYYNPQKKKQIKLPKRNAIKFKPSSKLSDKI